MIYPGKEPKQLNANRPESETAHLYLIPMGRVDTTAVSVVAANIQAVLGLNTQIQSILPEPEYAFVARRGQYDAGRILHVLASLPNRTRFSLGVVCVDIFTPILTFVFGESQLGGEAALISLFRIQSKDPETTFNRAAKIGIHEIGHLLGIVHCRAPDCLMVFSNNLLKLDALPLRFCPACEYEVRRRLMHLFPDPENCHRE